MKGWFPYFRYEIEVETWVCIYVSKYVGGVFTPSPNQKNTTAVLAARADGTGKRWIAKQLGIGVSTVNRIIAEAA